MPMSLIRMMTQLLDRESWVDMKHDFETKMSGKVNTTQGTSMN